MKLSRLSFIYIRRIHKIDICEKKGCKAKAKYVVGILTKKGEHSTVKYCSEHTMTHSIRCVNCGCYLHYSLHTGLANDLNITKLKRLRV